MTITEDLYQQAYDAAGAARDWRSGIRAVVDLALAARDEPTADGEALAQLVRDVRDGRSHSVTIDGVLIAPCDTYGRVEARHARETQPWEVLRDAAVIAYREGSDSTGFLDVIADRLEAAHRAEQEKTEPEKLIEQAIDTFVARYKSTGFVMDRPGKWSPVRIAFEAAADAGLLSAPESDGGAA
ncbi:hypothetical protein [Gordonia sp. SND2]|uniref:hypothetical protein n=1 Tax=Gordonia sp. SND2 TaxID=3388659 RepID=UPI00398BA623